MPFTSNRATSNRATTGVTSTGAAISARGLRKSFGEKTVLDGIDLTVQQGSILALLGPTGPARPPQSLTRQPPRSLTPWQGVSTK